MRSLCTICSKPTIGRGFCKNHYRAFMKYGDATYRSNFRGTSFQERFTVDKTTGCWMWIAGASSEGYGVMLFEGEKKAHRVSWIIHNGSIPTGLHVLHKCDTPACVNPKHLFLGTHQDNMADLRCKGRARGAVGEANHGAVLNKEQVLKIMTDSRTEDALAAAYGVSRETVNNIRNGRSWKHLFTVELKAARQATRSRRLSETERLSIAVDPRTQVVIAKEYGVTQGFVSAIKREFYK
jgi:DNA-binding XRE family transcriptional regulator